MRPAFLIPLALAALLPLHSSAGLFEAIREGDHAAVERLIAAGVNVNATLPGGNTPLLHAVITSDAKMVKLLISKGADAKAASEFGITALHAAVADLEKTRLLIAAGAEVNAALSDGRPPLFGAASRIGGAPVVELLIGAGANVNAVRSNGRGPLGSAAAAGDPDTVKLLLSHKADARAANLLGRITMQSDCFDCIRQLLDAGATATTERLADAAGMGSLELVKLLVERGVSVNGQDNRGYTPLMRAALSYTRNKDVVAYLLSKGAAMDPKNETGDTALSIARRFGETSISALLKEAGAPDAGTAATLPPPVRANTVAAAIRRGVPLLEKSAPAIFTKRACVTCHNNTLPAMVDAMASRRGFPIDEPVAAKEVLTILAHRRAQRQNLALGMSIPEISSYVLVALEAAGHTPSAATDLDAHQLAFRQEPDGSWRVGDYRPPQEYSRLAATGLAVGAMQRYAPPGRAQEFAERVQRARSWLLAAKPYGAEEHAMRLLGLGSTKAPAKEIDEAVRGLLAGQRPDGGWAQLPGMESDAYASGLALYALHQGGGVPASRAEYRQGVKYLLDTQRPDGSWFVQTRSYPFQPYFESGFPYGHSQWISAAGSSWALLSLLLTVQ